MNLDLGWESEVAVAAVFKALGDPHRVRIVNLLVTAGRPLCVCEITPHLGLAQATVSWHLKKLVAAGLLDRFERGTWAYYSINDRAAQALETVVRVEGAMA